MEHTIITAPYISLATFRRDGRKVATPIWAAEVSTNPNATTLVMFSDPDAGKVKRLRNSARAEVAICDVRGKLLGDWQDAQAFLIDGSDQGEVSAAAAAVRKKYGWQSSALDLVSRIGGRLARRQYIRIETAAPEKG